MKQIDIAGILRQSLPELTRMGAHSWEFSPGSDVKTRASVRIDPDWISVEAALGHPPEEPPLEFMLRQASWRGTAKRVLTHSRVALRADIPLLSDSAANREWLSRQLREAIAGIRAGLGDFAAPAAATEGGEHGYDPDVLAQCCSTAGWPASVKSDGELRVELESPSWHRAVTLNRQGTALRAAVVLDTGDLAQASAESRQAMGIFFLRASGSLRWVRPWTSVGDAEPMIAGFECLFCPGGDEISVLTAIDSIQAGCHAYGCEAEALARSPDLARHYLELMNRSWAMTASSPHQAVPRGSDRASASATADVLV